MLVSVDDPFTVRNTKAASDNPAVSDNPSGEMQQQLTFLGFLPIEERPCLPDWMVVAPPKTGTTWVTENLRLHPQIFVPRIKELKYFSNRFKTEDLRCYLAHFREGIGKKKGEAPPSYSLLPQSTIKLIHQLMPNLKIIYLMRDPIDRAWSHARHNFRYCEANFKGWTGTIDDPTDDDWIANFNDDWNRLAGDYLGQLQRWLSIFPREQIFIEFYENLVRAPRQTLRSLFEFLDVDPDFADSESVHLERANVGFAKELSTKLERQLAAVHAERTAELVEYLRREVNRDVPLEWQRTLGSGVGCNQTSRPSMCGEERADANAKTSEARVWTVDDETLAALLERDELLELDFLGFNIVQRDNQFMAYRMAMGELDHKNFSIEWWKDQEATGNSLFASNPYDLRSLIVNRIIADACPPGSEPARLRHLELQLGLTVRRQDDWCSRLSDVPKRLDALQETQGRVIEHSDALRLSHGEVAEQVGVLRCNYGEVAGQLERYAVRLQETHEELTKVRCWVQQRESAFWRRAVRGILARGSLFQVFRK